MQLRGSLNKTAKAFPTFSPIRSGNSVDTSNMVYKLFCQQATVLMACLYPLVKQKHAEFAVFSFSHEIPM